MRKNYLLVTFVIVLVLLTSLQIGFKNLEAVADKQAPEITSLSADPETVGFGFNVSITPTVTDDLSGVNCVKINITFPDATFENFTMDKIRGNSYKYEFTDTWHTGQYNYTVWAVDNASNANHSSQYSFNVSAQLTVDVATLKNNYTDNEYVNLTDPPILPEDYSVVDRGLTWNKYYNALTGNNILEIYDTPMNYQDAFHTWIPINETIEQLIPIHQAYTYGYRFGNEKGLYHAYFKPNIQDSWPIAFAFNKSTNPAAHIIRSKLLGVGYLDPENNWAYHYLQNVQSSQGSINGDSVLYEDVFTGVDIVYSYENAKLKENILLSNATKNMLLTHPPSLYGCSDTSFLVFITKLDFQNLHLYNSSTPITGNLTISEGQIDFRTTSGMLQCSLPIGDVFEMMNETARRQLVYRIVHFNGNYYLLSGVRITDLMEMDFPVIVDPSQQQNTWMSSTNDGYIYKSSSTSYNAAWSSGTGTISSSADYITIGQNKGFTFPNPTYYVYRGFLFFNTSSLPSNAYIDNATLSLYKKGDNSTTDFTLTIQNGQPTYPHNPLLFGDYNKSYYSGNGGGLSTTSFVNGRNNITLTNHSWIQKGGLTKLCLRSSRDINGTSPTGKEYVDVYSREKGTSFAPKLSIFYRNQSKIKNVGSTDIKGYLKIQVQYYCDAINQWIVDHTTVAEDTPRTIHADEYLALDGIFNGKVNSSNLIFWNGTYRVYAALCDPDGTVLRSNDGTLVSEEYAFQYFRALPLGWHCIMSDGFGQVTNIATRGVTIYKNELYVGTENYNKSKMGDNIGKIGFAAGTKVTMADNSLKNIEDIEINDSVKAYDIGTCGFVNASVISVFYHPSEDQPEYYVNINNKLCVGRNQTLFVNQSILQAQDVLVGSVLKDANLSNVSVSSVQNKFEQPSMYHIELSLDSEDSFIPNNLTFFANDVQVYPWLLFNDSVNLGTYEPASVIGRNAGTLLHEGSAIYRAFLSDGCELWKYNYTTKEWTVLIGRGDGVDYGSGFGSTYNLAVGDMIEFNGKLYVGTWNSPLNGSQIWRYDGSDWEQVIGPIAVSTYGVDNSGGFNNRHNMGISNFKIFENSTGVTHLYAGTINLNWRCIDGCCQLWRTTDGENWERVVNRGFRDKGAGWNVKNVYLWSLEEFDGKLYAGTFNIPSPNQGCQLWRSGTGNVDADDWEKVSLPNGTSELEDFLDGFGEESNYGIRSMVNWDDYLYVGVAANAFAGECPVPEAIEIWRFDGTNNDFDAWDCVIGDDSGQYDIWGDGFGDYYNKYPWSMALVDDKLWIGTSNVQYIYRYFDAETKGCEVWCYDGTDLIPIVKDNDGEIQNGFIDEKDVKNGGARSMLEYPENTGKLVVGTMRVHSYIYDSPDWTEKGCQVWIREG